MPRFRRRIVPGSVQHLVSRFVNREFLLDLPGARERYLHDAARAFERSDWRPLAYALMSSHVHWVAVAGDSPSHLLIRSMHCGFAGWLNRSSGRLGPVFADRHRNVECASETAAALIPYVHNNPDRAGLVEDPMESAWTSHRAYVGLEPAPTWLYVDLGLRLCGFDTGPQGRAGFHALVFERRREGRRTDWGADDLQARQRVARKRLALPIEVASPRVAGSADALRRSVPIVVPTACPKRFTRTESASSIVRIVAAASGLVERQLCGRSRSPQIVAARRLAIDLWCDVLAGPVNEIAAALGISGQAVSKHRRRCTLQEHATAERLAAALNGDGPNFATLQTCGSKQADES